MESKQKTPGELRREALFYQPKNGYDRMSAEDEAAMQAYCEEYKHFLDAGKTERECVEEAVRLAEAKGFKPFTRGMGIQPGDKLYRVNRGKSVMLAVVGAKSLSEGANIGAAHIDSPRLDLKPNPLYEAEELAFFKTHYYGGIRKYQWVTIPLELRGAVALKDGRVVHGVRGRIRRGARVHGDGPAAPSGRRAVQEALGRSHARREPECAGGQPPLQGRRGLGAGEAGHSGPAQPEVRHCGGGLHLRRAHRRARLQGRGHRF